MKHKQKVKLAKKVKELSHEELVATYQYVSGLFARQQEKMSPLLSETVGDMNILKHEILDRIFKPRIAREVEGI